MGERLVCNQEVIGSIPFTSTSLRPSGYGWQATLRGSGFGWQANVNKGR